MKIYTSIKYRKLLFKIIPLATFIVGSNGVFAQNSAANFIRAGKEDANKLISAYLQPITKGLASGVNDAWYSTAKPLGLLGFEIKTGLGASIVNDDAKSFTLNGIGTNSDPKSPFLLTPIDGDRNTKQPTIVGDGKSTRFMVSTYFLGSQIPVDTITSFSGTGSPVSFGAIPFIQVSLGLVKGTEIMVRLMPINYGDFSSNGFGFGVKHSISQWIWGVDKLPIDISGVYSYNNNNLTYFFGDKFLDANGDPGSLPSSEYRNSQKLAVSTSGHQFGAIISKKLSVFTPYLGLTFNRATSEMAMKGIYPIQSVRENSVTHLPEQYIENIIDPVTLSNTVNSTRAAIGFRIKVTAIAFGAEYNHAFSADQFSTFNATFAINIQQLAPIPKL